MLLLAALTALTLIVITGASGCGSESTTTSAGDPGTESAGFTEENIRELAESRHANPMVVREVEITGEGDDREISIDIDRPATLQDGSVVGVMGAYSQHVFTTLFEDARTASVTITMYGVEQAVPGDEVAIMLKIDREDLDNVDWSMFGPMMLSDMVSEYYVAPEIEESTWP